MIQGKLQNCSCMIFLILPCNQGWRFATASLEDFHESHNDDEKVQEKKMIDEDCAYICVLRVLLAKDPDISLPTFGAPSMFGCIIKSTYHAYVPEPKS